MKKTQFKDAIRNIQKQFVSFLSIVVIAMMAVVAYLGIVYSAEATVRGAESYFNAHRMWDIQITSTLLMGQEDLDAVRALDYVELAEPVQVFPAYLMAEGQKENVSLMSLSKELAAYDLTAGRPPETTQECMLEKSIADAYGYEVGSRIHLENETLAGIDPILQKDYVVSGLFIHPDHISPQVPLTPYILVLDACFDQETLDGQFSQMLVQVRGAPAERYGKVYQKLIDDVEADLAPLAERRAAERTADVRGRYEKDLQEARDKLSDAAQKLRDSRRMLDDGWAELEQGAEKLGIGKEQLDGAPPLMQDAEARIREGEAMLKAGKAQLDQIAGYIQNGVDWIKERVTRDIWPENEWVSYDEFMDAVNSGEAALLEFYGLYDAKTAQPLAVPGSGALVPKRFHEAYEIPVGDSFTLYDSAMNSSEVRVAGVFNNYFGHLLFFSPAAYRAAFGSEVETNCFLVKTGEMSLDELSGKLSDLQGFLSVKDAAAERTWFNDLSGLINYVVVLMIFIAGMMAYFILVNLSKTYILKKSRELTIMRINGFTVKECVRYAAWDLFLTTVAGILLGMAVGGPLGSWVIQRLEQPFLQYVRTPDVRSFIFGALITAAFSYLINASALRRVKHLKLSDLS